MELRISVRSGKVSDQTKEHIESACAKLHRFYDRIIDCEVVVETEKAGKTVEFIVKVPQHTLTASYTDENLYRAIDETQSRVEAQLKKHHDKQVAHR